MTLGSRLASGSGLGSAAAGVAVAFALTLSACAAAPETTVQLPPPPQTEVAPEPDTQPEEEPEVAWVTFSDERIDHTFSVPENWSVELAGEDQYGYAVFTVLDDDGEEMLHFWRWVTSTGEDCRASDIVMSVEEYDSTPIPIYGEQDPQSEVRFVYRISHAEGYPYVGSLAIANGYRDMGGSCIYSNLAEGEAPAIFADAVRVNLVNPEHNPDHEFDTLEEAVAFMDSTEYKILKQILTSTRGS